MERMTKIANMPGDLSTFEYKGILYPKLVAALPELENWEVRQDDVIIVTYPKSGTTWMQEIASVIMNNGDLEKVNQRHTSLRVVFLETFPVSHYSQVHKVRAPHRVLDRKPSPRLYRTHLPHSTLPRQIFEKNPKIIYVYRNPKDVLVSYYHYHTIISGLPDYSSFEEFHKDFCEGKVSYGPWHQHVLFWWAKRHEPNVLVMSYEDMQKNLEAAILKVAKFMERQLPPETLAAVVRHCSFDGMKTNPMTNMDTVLYQSDAIDSTAGPHAGFMRKGKVGDWRNYFSATQNKDFDVLCRDWLKDSDLRYQIKSNL